MLELLETYGLKLGRPYTKQLRRDIRELRIRGKQEVRIFYQIKSSQAIILHAFLKKSQKIPQQELQTVLRRSKQIFNS